MAEALAACEYKTGRTLGKGSYATVKEAVKISTGEKFAVKQISKKLMSGKEHMILNEIDILKKISQGHPNIVTLWDYFETPNNLYLVMDLCTGGELFDRICDVGQFYEHDAADIVRTVCEAVAYLHEKNIVHRDIKPENMLFKNPEPDSPLLLADFGLSKLTNSDAIDSLKTMCGTPGYMAPEIVKKTGHGKPVDIWAIGVMSYFLLCGYMPFESSTNVVEFESIVAAKYSFDPNYWSDISANAKNFIERILLVDPQKRMTIQEALKHPWLIKGSGDKKSAKDLYPKVNAAFNARKVFKKAIDVVKAVNKLSSSNLHKENGLTVPDRNGGLSRDSSFASLAVPDRAGLSRDASFASLAVPERNGGLSRDASFASLNNGTVHLNVPQ